MCLDQITPDAYYACPAWLTSVKLIPGSASSHRARALSTSLFVIVTAKWAGFILKVSRLMYYTAYYVLRSGYASISPILSPQSAR